MADAVREYQDAYEARVKEEFVLTTIGKEIFETLDHALGIGKMVVIEGESGSGKTTAVEAWCAAHQGQVRFVSPEWDHPQDWFLSETGHGHRSRRFKTQSNRHAGESGRLFSQDPPHACDRRSALSLPPTSAQPFQPGAGRLGKHRARKSPRPGRVDLHRPVCEAEGSR